MDELEKSLLEKLILEALSELYEKDQYLIYREGSSNDSGNHVAERAIVFQFGTYLHDLMYRKMSLLGDYKLDCEYNRKQYDIKRLPSFPNGAYPDLIIHKRGSMKNNLLVIEIKTWWNPDNKGDIEKINQLLDPKKEYKYKFGLSIIIEKNYPPNLKWIPEESSEV